MKSNGSDNDNNGSHVFYDNNNNGKISKDNKDKDVNVDIINSK